MAPGYVAPGRSRPYREGVTGTDIAERGGVVERLRLARRRIRSTRFGRLALQAGVGLVGAALIVVGIILLPLPGPGWLIIFAGLGVLATEFEWAARLLRFARTQVSRWTAWAAQQGRLTQLALGAAGLLLLVALVGAGWWLYTR